MKNKNYKYLVGLVIGLLLVSSVYGASSMLSSDVIYDSTNSSYSNGSVQGAIDDLSGKIERPTECPDKTYCIPYKSELAVGDYVSYTPTVTSYPTDTTYTGYSSSQTIYPSELNLWRVLNINNDGTIDLISEYVSSTDVYFKGLTGYKNFVGYLNVLASQYETEGITDAEDGSRYFGFKGQTEYITDTSMFTSTPPFGCSTDGTAGNCTNTDYPNDPDDYEAYGGGDTLYTTDYDRVNTVLGTRIAYKVGTNTATAYWMASRYYGYSSASYYLWYGRKVSTSGSYSSNSLYLYGSGSFNEYSRNNALRPIVTLKSGLQYEGIGIIESPMKIITS